MTTWYGKSAVKELDGLIERKPKLSELLLNGEFLSELKAFNSKLLDYVSSNPALIGEMIELITVPPSYNDSDERKYKLPLLAIEMIETQTTCILNNFFKDTHKHDDTYFDTLFHCLNDPELLPILAGYLFRVNLCLMNNRQKETLDRVYANGHILNKLVNHANHMAITNILQLFLNLDSNKNQSVHSQQRLKIKLSVLNLIISKIKTQHSMRTQDSSTIIENLCSVLLETIEKYYLIVDGKQMMEIITSDKIISVMMTLIQSNIYDHAFSGCNFLISLINYYSFSSFNSDDLNTEAGKKNLQRLQTQPMIIELCAFFTTGVDRIMKAQTITLNYYKLLEVLCHCISISSLKIFQCIKKTQFFACLVKLLFTHDKNNILHMLIEKSFLHLFISDRKIYGLYKKHLFCELDIIDCTAGAFMKMFPTEQMFKKALRKPYFGHFMRILKIYSGIQTLDEDIINAIKAKTQLWNQITKHLIVPYENIYEKKLGSYENVGEPVAQEFKIGKALELSKSKENTVLIKQIEEEENLSKVKMEANTQPKFDELSQKNQELFSKTQINNNFLSNDTQNQSAKQRPNHYLSQSNIVDYSSNEKELKKSQSFKQFMHKKKAEAEQQIKMKRSLSQERRLSGQKAKITNSSPSKKNSWREDTNEDKSQNKKQQNLPKIPLNKKNLLNVSSVSERRTTPIPKKEDVEEKASSRSMMNMGELRKIKVYQIEKPKDKKFRRIEDQDKPLLSFLGLLT